MGSGVSVESEKLVRSLVSVASDFRSQSSVRRLDAWKQIWQFSDDDKNKHALANRSLGLLTLIVKVLQSDDLDWSEQFLAAKCAWYISRLSDETTFLLSSEPGMNEVMFHLLDKYKLSNDFVSHQQPFLNYFRNIFINQESSRLAQSSLGSPLLRLLLYFLGTDQESNTCEVACIAMRNLVDTMQETFIPTMLGSGIPERIIFILNEYGPNPNSWTRRNGLPQICLYFLQNFVFHAECSEYLRYIGGMHLMEPLINTDGGEMLIAVVAISFMDGSNERSLLKQFPTAEPLLIDAFEAALDVGKGAAYDRMTRLWGYNWNFTTMKILSGALKLLSVSDSNKSILVSNRRLLTLLLRSLESFVRNDPEISTYSGVSKNTIGGGGRDVVTAAAVLETLLNLSYNFESDKDLRNNYMTSSLHIDRALQSFINLPADRNVTADMARHAVALLKRLLPATIPASPTAIKTDNTPDTSSQAAATLTAAMMMQKQQHCMISYAWGANKPFVIQLVSTLRNLGLDVWRDEEGSNIAPKLAGDIDNTLAQVIELSHTVIICVSKAYKNSVNCRSEAQYCRQRQQSHNLNIIYVMMDQNYTLRSSPDCVNGWLAFMLGSELWYPLWSQEKIADTASELFKAIDLKLASKLLVDNTLASMLTVSAAKKGQEISAATVTAVATAVPSECSGRDFQKAWKVLVDSNSDGVGEYLKSLSLDSAEYLNELEPHELQELAGKLEGVKKRAFVKAMLITAN